MTLLWKLLRKHISLPQLAGFFFANLIGMLIILLSIQFYRDVRPVFSQEDGFMKPEYLVVSKHVTSMDVLGSENNTSFSENEIADIQQQSFCRSVGKFSSSNYRVQCSLGIEGIPRIGTEMFFESVPDEFVDVKSEKWRFNPSDSIVPIILPKSYLAIYNFGFAQSQRLPKLSEGIVGMLELEIRMCGNELEERMKGRVVGFSNRLNTILVPQNFITWSNERLAPEVKGKVNRLIVEVKNPTDDAIVSYLNDNGYELEDNKLDAGKTTYFLRVVVLLVMSIGIIISILSFYILMLSIYLLVQKNSEKLNNLLLIGFNIKGVSLPYQLLTVGMNALTLTIAFMLLLVIRSSYMDMLWSMFPEMPNASLWTTAIVGVAIFLAISLLNIVVIRNKIMQIWNHKE